MNDNSVRLPCVFSSVFGTISFILLCTTVELAFSTFYTQSPSPYDHYNFETPQQTFQYAKPSPMKLQSSQGSTWTMPSMNNYSTGGSDHDLQNNPTFQKNVYFQYNPMPPPPRRRRRLFPYFLLGFATGSSAILGGAVVAGAFRG